MLVPFFKEGDKHEQHQNQAINTNNQNKEFQRESDSLYQAANHS